MATSNLVGRTALVVGGVGTIGRGLVRSLLNAGAVVVVNSRSNQKLERLTNDLGNPENLLLFNGTMMPSGAEETFGHIFSRVGHIDHVVAHCGVRWWDSRGVHESGLPMQRGHIFDQSVEDFRLGATQLLDLHWTVARHTLPRMQGQTGASYTLVTGGKNVRQNDMATMNTICVQGLAALLRRQAAKGLTGDVDVSELRVELKVGRSAEERSKDPRAIPLSTDIGDVTAGIVQAAYDAAKGESSSGLSPPGSLYYMASDQDKNHLKRTFPCSAAATTQIPGMWNWEHTPMKAA